MGCAARDEAPVAHSHPVSRIDSTRCLAVVPCIRGVGLSLKSKSRTLLQPPILLATQPAALPCPYPSTTSATSNCNPTHTHTHTHSLLLPNLPQPVYSFGVLMLETYHGVPTHKLIRRQPVPDYELHSQDYSARLGCTLETASAGQHASPRPSIPQTRDTRLQPVSATSDTFNAGSSLQTVSGFGFQTDPRQPNTSSPQHRPMARPHPVFSADLLAFPPGCPPEYVALANACLQEDWSRRPSFFHVSRALLALQQQVKSEAVADLLGQVEPSPPFPGSVPALSAQHPQSQSPFRVTTSQDSSMQVTGSPRFSKQI